MASDDTLNPSLEIDFSGVTPASGGTIVVLPKGFYRAPIESFRHFAAEGGGVGRMRVYFSHAEGSTFESFDLADKGRAYLLGMFIAAGIIKESPNKKVKIDFAKHVGKHVCFEYTPPPPDVAGGQKQYAKHRFVTEAEYAAALKRTTPVADDTVAEGAAKVEAKAATSAKVEAAPAKSDDFEL